MKKHLAGAIIMWMFLFAPACAQAEVIQTVTDTTKAAVLVPVNLVKFVGGAFKTVGEVLLLPFRVLS